MKLGKWPYLDGGDRGPRGLGIAQMVAGHFVLVEVECSGRGEGSPREVFVLRDGRTILSRECRVVVHPIVCPRGC